MPFALLVFAGVAAAADPSVLIRDVERLIELQQAARREQTQWDIQRESLERRFDLLQREKALLGSRLAEIETDAEADDAVAAALNARLARRAQRLWEADQALAATENRFALARQAVPEDLRDTLPAEAPAQAALLARLQAAMALSAAIHRLDQSVHHHRRVMVAPDGGRRQFDVLNLGLAQAYAVSPDNRLAGHGYWNGASWDWSWNPAWAAAIRQAVRIHQGDLPPRWVPLPVATAKATGEDES